MSEFTKGQEVWSQSLQERVVIVFVIGDYAQVRDESNNSYALPVKDLRPLEWDAGTIVDRES